MHVLNYALHNLSVDLRKPCDILPGLSHFPCKPMQKALVLGLKWNGVASLERSLHQSLTGHHGSNCARHKCTLPFDVECVAVTPANCDFLETGTQRLAVGGPIS